MRTIRKSVMLAALMAAVTFTSCSNDDEVTDNNQPVRFTAGVGEVATLQTTPGTRASGATWGDGDAIGIFMVEHEGTTIAEDAENKQYTTPGDGAFTTVVGNEIYYPMDNSLVDFIAYYPWEDGATLTELIDVTIGEQTDENQPTFDLLWAKANNDDDDGYNRTTEGAVILAFEHKLAKIVMNITADASAEVSSLVGMTVTIESMNTVNTFNLSTGELGATPSDPEFITPRTVNDGSVYDAIIMPGSYEVGEVKVTFEVEEKIFTWDVGAVSFDGGNEYTYAVTLIRRTEVEVTSVILPWITDDNDRDPVTAE